MSMKITEEENVLVKNQLDKTEKTFSVKNFWMDEAMGIPPSPVQILPG
jgi:hypothetical protein